MLADKFEIMRRLVEHAGIASKVSHLTDGIFEIGALVKQSERFVIDRSVVMMASNLTLGGYSSILRALPICRLPSSEMWIEFPFAYRAEWLEAASKDGVPVLDSQRASPPIHLGFYLSEFMLEENRFLTVHPVWNHRDDQIEVGRKMMVIDVSPVGVNFGKLDDQRELGRDPAHRRKEGFPKIEDWNAFVEAQERITYFKPQMMDSYWAFASSQGPAFYEKCESDANYDLASEWRFILSLLAVINSRNLTKIGEPVNFEKLNKARAKTGKPLLLDHKPIKLVLSKVQRNRFTTGYYGTRASPEEPFKVIGHFKTRQTGVFWWHEHKRGTGEAPSRDHAVVAGTTS